MINKTNKNSMEFNSNYAAIHYRPTPKELDMEHQPLKSSIWNVSEWAYAGVEHSLAGNGGPDCVAFLTIQRRILESILALFLSIALIVSGMRTAELPKIVKSKVVRQDRGGKRLLLVFMCIIYGMEFGFKFSSRTMIYILNPCHVITLLELVLLGAPPTNKWMTILFRIHIHCMNCPILALLFPVLNTRLLAFEQQNYWIQHILMLVIPFYLLRTGVGGVFTMEPMSDFSWAKITVGVQMFYHFFVLQPLAVYTQVNLNSMLCPAVSDPFYSQNYRVYAIIHQSLLIPIVGKLYTALSIFILKALGSIVWTGEKYVAMATLRMQQMCSMCTLRLAATTRTMSEREDESFPQNGEGDAPGVGKGNKPINIGSTDFSNSNNSSNNTYQLRSASDGEKKVA